MGGWDIKKANISNCCKKGSTSDGCKEREHFEEALEMTLEMDHCQLVRVIRLFRVGGWVGQ